jgi:zinc transport system substrate-binding protein
MRHFFLTLAAAALAPLTVGAWAQTPNVVVSIAPLHGLTASVMQSVGEPRLLLPPGASPHSFSLRPSAARAIARANLIVWVGPALENFMERPLKALAKKDRLLTLATLGEMKLLKVRDDHLHGRGHDHGHANGIDPHLWLSSGNAKAIATAVAARLIAVDPDRKAAYARNLKATLAAIAKTEQDIGVLLSPVRAAPYATFHDAFQYFERAFGLTGGAWVAVDASRRPSAKRLSALRRDFAKRNVRCVFSEPQFPSSLLKTLTDGTGAKIAALDPLGSKIGSGPGHWNETMLTLARSLRNCLSSP